MKLKYLALTALPIGAFVIASCTQNQSVANDSGINFVKKDSSNPAAVAKFQNKEITMQDLE